MKLWRKLFLVLILFCIKSCTQSDSNNVSDNLLNNSINQKDVNGIAVGLWEHYDYNNELKERYFFTPTYENGNVIQRVKMEKYDRGVLSYKFTNKNYFDQEKNIIVDTFQVFGWKGKVIVDGLFSEEGHAIGTWKYYENDGEELTGNAKVEIEGQNLIIFYTDYSENKNKPELSKFSIPMTRVRQNYETIAYGFYNEHLENMAYDPIVKFQNYKIEM